MKIFRLAFITTFLLIFSISKSFSQKDTVNPSGFNVFHYPNGFKLSQGYMRDGKPDGYWTTYYVNGNKKSEGNRKNYIIDSLWIFYAENGDTTESIYYVNGKRSGFDTKYYTRLDSGKNVVKSKELYIDDIKQGNAFYFYPNGELQYKVKFKNNIRDGSGFEYSRDGNLIALLEYRNDFLISRQPVNRTDTKGQHTGTWIELYDNGQVKQETNYVNGLPNGFSKEYSPSGKIIKIESYNNGLMTTELTQKQLDTLLTQKIEIKQEYYPNNRLKSVRMFRDSTPVGLHVFYNENGAVTNAILYNDFGERIGEGKVDSSSKKQGMWTFFENDSIKIAEGNYSNDLKDGQWKYYYNDAKIRQIGDYSQDSPTGKWLWYYESGAVLREENYEGGLLNGQAFEFSPEKDTIVKCNYIDGKLSGDWYSKIGDEKIYGKYFFGSPEGQWKSYYIPENKIKSIYKYSDGKLNGDYVNYYKNKNPREKGQYSNDAKQGKWTYYLEDGSIDYTAEYIKDKILKINDMKIE